MNKIYVFYLMCLGISLIFLTTYFSIVYSEYATSIFYIVNMILVSSIALLLFIEGRFKSFSNKIILLSISFLILYFGLIIVENLFVLTRLGSEFVSIFSIFFLMCSVIMMLLSSISLRKESIFNNKYYVGLIFSPIIIFSLWVLINNYFINNDLMSSISLRLFLIAFTLTYSILILFNLLSSSIKVLALKNKFLFISSGIFIILVSSGFRQSGLFFELASIFSVSGCFLICMGLIMDTSLELHNYMLVHLLSNLKGKKKKGFVKFLQKNLKKSKGLIAQISEDNIIVFDNPNLSNIEEKKKYEKLILVSYKWYRKNVKGSSKFLKSLKLFYNKQVLMSRRLALFLI